MISQASDYLFVSGDGVDEGHPHGDLDRIVLDGEIMPLRTGNTDSVDKDGNQIPRANIIRGEDVSFLMEASEERCAAAFQRSPQAGRSFSRKITSANPQQIVSNIHSLATDGTWGGYREHDSRVWIKPDAELGPKYGCRSNETLWSAYEQDFLGKSDIVSIAGPVGSSPLYKSNVLGWFADVAKFTRFQHEAQFSPPTQSKGNYYYDGIFDREKANTPEGLAGYYQMCDLYKDGEQVKADVQSDCMYSLNNQTWSIGNNSFRYAKKNNIKLYGRFLAQDISNFASKSYYELIPFVTLHDFDVGEDGAVFASNYAMLIWKNVLARAQSHCASDQTPFSWYRWFSPVSVPTGHFEDIGSLWVRKISINLVSVFSVCELRDRTRWQN